MVDCASHQSDTSFNVVVRAGTSELRASSLLEANYANRQEPKAAYPSSEAPLRMQKLTKTANVMLT